MADYKICKFDGCVKPARARGWCSPHYQRWRVHGDPEISLIDRSHQHAKPIKTCSIDGCERPALSRGWCNPHYHRWGRTGAVETERPVADIGKKRRHTCKKSGYVYFADRAHPEASKNGNVLEHRAVMADVLGRQLLPGESVHHLNGDRSDNRPENLELWVTLQPSGQRPSDLLAYAREIIARYEPRTGT